MRRFVLKFNFFLLVMIASLTNLFFQSTNGFATEHDFQRNSNERCKLLGRDAFVDCDKLVSAGSWIHGLLCKKKKGYSWELEDELGELIAKRVDKKSYDIIRCGRVIAHIEREKLGIGSRRVKGFNFSINDVLLYKIRVQCNFKKPFLIEIYDSDESKVFTNVLPRYNKKRRCHVLDLFGRIKESYEGNLRMISYEDSRTYVGYDPRKTILLFGKKGKKFVLDYKVGSMERVLSFALGIAVCRTIEL